MLIGLLEPDHQTPLNPRLSAIDDEREREALMAAHGDDRVRAGGGLRVVHVVGHGSRVVEGTAAGAVVTRNMRVPPYQLVVRHRALPGQNRLPRVG